MGLRDIAIAIIVIVCASSALRKPHVGFYAWVWLSLMTPHKLGWGFIQTMPVAQITILGTLFGLLWDKNRGRFFQHGIVALQVFLLLWTVVTTIYGVHPDNSFEGLSKFSKIMLGIFISYLVINTRDKLDSLLWIIFLSVGFFGIKGGIFTLQTAGSFRVWGPPDSFIADNNALACALLMVMPIGAYLLSITQNKNVRTALVVSIGLIGVSVLGSNSRGAFLGLIAVLLFWLRKAPGTHKITIMVIAMFIGVIALTLMPESYWERMHTMKDYEKDASAMGRINAWTCAYNLAKDRLLGAGYDYASPYVFKLYAPDPLDLHTAHSIYFQILGDHGFIGLFLFLWILGWTWILLGQIIRKTQVDELKWANTLARMLQLSLISYSTAGAFLSLPYYDLYWQLVAIAIILNTLVSKSGVVPATVASKQPGYEPQPRKFQPFIRPVN